MREKRRTRWAASRGCPVRSLAPWTAWWSHTLTSAEQSGETGRENHQ